MHVPRDPPLAMRARIVVTAHTHPTWNERPIAQPLGVSDRLVRKWRQRWEETHCLSDLPRSGAPRRFSVSRTCDSFGSGL